MAINIKPGGEGSVPLPSDLVVYDITTAPRVAGADDGLGGMRTPEEMLNRAPEADTDFVRHLHLNEDGSQPGIYTDRTDITSAECTYNAEEHTWDVVISNLLQVPGGVAEGANGHLATDIKVTGWRRGRYDTYRSGAENPDEPVAQGRAFGSYITITLVPEETVRLHITQDPKRPPRRTPINRPTAPPSPAPEPSTDAAKEILRVQLQRLLDSL